MTAFFQKLMKLMVVVTLVGVGAAVPAWAHGASKPKHGGMVVMDGETLFELVVTDKHVDLYVTYDDEDIDSAAYVASLTVKQAGEKQKSDLSPAGDNRFEADGVSIAKDAHIIVFIKNQASHASASARFVVE